VLVVCYCTCSAAERARSGRAGLFPLGNLQFNPWDTVNSGQLCWGCLHRVVGPEVGP